MYPLNDKDLDRLSRDAAEQFDAESSASGWEHLEQRLNKELPVKDEKDRRRFLFWIFLLALLSGGALVGMLSNYNKSFFAKKVTVQPSQPGNTTQQPDGVTGKKETVSSPEAGNESTPATTNNTAGNKTDANKNTVEKTIPVQNEPAVSQKQTTQQPSAIQKELAKLDKKDKPNAVPVLPTRLGKKQTTKDQSDVTINNKKNNSPKQKDKPVADNNSDVQQDQQQKTTDITANKPAEKVTTPAADITNNNSTDKTDKQNEIKKEEDVKKEEPVAVVKKEPAKKTKTKVTQPLELGVVVGPDFTRVNFGQGDKAGYNIGVQVGYRFANRWSVNSGLLYTKKNYTAAGEDFTPPKHSWISYVDLHKVQGYCSMFEIPVNIRYDLNSNTQKRFFVSTGLSSYLMKKEYYDYYFTYQGVDRKEPWQRDSTVGYISSILNLSAGYERAIGKNFSLQAEPYFRIPLKGLGYGTMNLDSYGIYFTLKYKPAFGKKK